MVAYTTVLPVKLMVGVVAAFELLSGNVSESPDWMKRSGLQWLYRRSRSQGEFGTAT